MMVKKSRRSGNKTRWTGIKALHADPHLEFLTADSVKQQNKGLLNLKARGVGLPGLSLNCAYPRRCQEKQNRKFNEIIATTSLLFATMQSSR